MNVIEGEFHVTWRPPVFVRIGIGPLAEIDGPAAALALLHLWPGQRELKEVRTTCVDAINRRGSVELARIRFVKAAKAAEVL
jgi:hypothetical protein